MSASKPTRKRRDKLRGPEATRKRIGREIADVRRRKGYTQEALAALIGSSRRTLSRVENGKPGVALDVYTDISELIGPLQNFRYEKSPALPDLSNAANWTPIWTPTSAPGVD